jgi:hypothetical protein
VLLYWRSFTYDKYTGQGWETSRTSIIEYETNQSLRSPQAPYHILIRQIVRSVGQKTSTVYAAGEPIMINQPSEVAWRSTGDLFGIQLDNTAGYEVSSLLPVVDEGYPTFCWAKLPGLGEGSIIFYCPRVYRLESRIWLSS